MCDSVAIIEHGCLLAKGTVAEIQNRNGGKHAAGYREVRIRVLSRASDLAAWCENYPGIEKLVRTGQLVTLHHCGDSQAEAALLRAAVVAGFEIISFGGRDETLEDVFMSVTRGQVQ